MLAVGLFSARREGIIMEVSIAKLNTRNVTRFLLVDR